MENSVLWSYTIEYYEKLVKEKFEYSLQLNLVKQIANSQYAIFLYPSTSHFSLVLSPKENGRGRLNSSSISLKQLDEHRFDVTYSPKQFQTHNISKRTLNYSDVYSYLESLILKLKLNSEKLETN